MPAMGALSPTGCRIQNDASIRGSREARDDHGDRGRVCGDRESLTTCGRPLYPKSSRSIPGRRGFRWNEATRTSPPSEGPQRRRRVRLSVESVLPGGDSREAASGEHHALEKKRVPTKASTEDLLTHRPERANWPATRRRTRSSAAALRSSGTVPCHTRDGGAGRGGRCSRDRCRPAPVRPTTPVSLARAGLFGRIHRRGRSRASCSQRAAPSTVRSRRTSPNLLPGSSLSPATRAGSAPSRRGPATTGRDSRRQRRPTRRSVRGSACSPRSRWDG